MYAECASTNTLFNTSSYWIFFKIRIWIQWYHNKTRHLYRLFAMYSILGQTLQNLKFNLSCNFNSSISSSLHKEIEARSPWFAPLITKLYFLRQAMTSSCLYTEHPSEVDLVPWGTAQLVTACHSCGCVRWQSWFWSWLIEFWHSYWSGWVEHLLIPDLPRTTLD